MKEFYATLIISSPEEEKTIKFLIEAESFEKAVESIKADLDIE
jgi:hypothetical protein